VVDSALRPFAYLLGLKSTDAGLGTSDSLGTGVAGTLGEQISQWSKLKPRPCLVLQERTHLGMERPLICSLATFGKTPLHRLPPVFRAFIVPVCPNLGGAGMEHIHSTPEWPEEGPDGESAGFSQWLIALPYISKVDVLRFRWGYPGQFLEFISDFNVDLVRNIYSERYKAWIRASIADGNLTSQARRQLEVSTIFVVSLDSFAEDISCRPAYKTRRSDLPISTRLAFQSELLWGVFLIVSRKGRRRPAAVPPSDPALLQGREAHLRPRPRKDHFKAPRSLSCLSALVRPLLREPKVGRD
jgi:hypothetical protein